MLRIEYGPEGGDELDLLTKAELKLIPAFLPLTNPDGEEASVKKVLETLDEVEMYDEENTVWGLIRRDETSL